jgi:hypothetical protein
LATARKRFKALSREVVSDPGETRAAIALSKLLRWCHPLKSRCPQTAFRRFIAISATFDPRLVDGKSYATLARELRITKASVSDTSRKFRDHFGYYSHEFRGAAGREHMRDARLAQRIPGAAKALPRNVRN